MQRIVMTICINRVIEPQAAIGTVFKRNGRFHREEIQWIA
jgi:hypothetical protein